jgi:hypothetical protein
MKTENVQIVQEEEKWAKEWQCELPFNISDNSEFETIVNVLNYVDEGKFAVCGHVVGVTRQQGYPEPCMLRFPSIYTGRQSWDDLCANLKKSDEKQGFQFIVHNTANSAQARDGHFPALAIEY